MAFKVHPSSRAIFRKSPKRFETKQFARRKVNAFVELSDHVGFAGDGGI